MTIPDLQKCKRDARKITVVTAYDALFSRIVEQAGIDVILVGDSLGVVVQGKANTLSVTMDEMLYHTRLVAGTVQRSLVIGDMPFMSYQVSQEDALRNAGRFLQAGAHAVKLEGGGGGSGSRGGDGQDRHPCDGPPWNDTAIGPSIRWI